jgi:hypothetical protein
MADQQADQWAVEQRCLGSKTKPEYIATTLEKYADEAAAIAHATKRLHERFSSFWQRHLGIDGNLYRYDRPKVAATPPKPDIDGAAVLEFLQQLHSKLNEVTDTASAARKAWTNNHPDVWKQTFVAHLGLIWQDLMKKPPPGSDLFKDFVADAWASLEGNPKESFDRTVRDTIPGFKARTVR